MATGKPAHADRPASAFVVGSYIDAHFLGVPSLPVPGQSLAAHSVHREHGGKGLNLAVGLHRLGLAVLPLLAVGDDEAGMRLRAWLRASGLSDLQVRTLGPRSGYGVGFVAADGANFLAVHPGANALLGAGEVDSALDAAPGCDWVCGQFEVPEAALLQAFRRARAGGARSYLNPSPWRSPSPRLLEVTDVLVLNEAEAAALFGLEDAPRRSAARWAAELPGRAARIGWRRPGLVITLAEHGSLALDDSGRAIHAPAWDVTQTDATGAGDAFGCGLLACLSRQQPLDEALRFGNACGALVATRAGVLDALPSASEVTDFLRHAQPRS